MDVILYLYKRCKEIVLDGKSLTEIIASGIFETVTKMKYDVPNDHIELLDDYMPMIDKAVNESLNA